MTSQNFAGAFARDIAERIKQQVDSKINIPQVTEQAALILSEPKRLANEGFFQPNGRRLHLKWSTENQFRGCAAQSGTDDFDIIFSYESAICIWQDAIRMKAVLAKSPLILEVLGLDQSGIILPWPQRPSEKNILKFLFELPLKWLFFHELGHLVEGHGDLPEARHIVKRTEGRMEIHDAAATAESVPLTGRNAWVSHCLEIAADYQGVRLLIRTLIALQGRISELEAWALVVGMTCLFHRFHGEGRANVQTEAVGSHPDPTLRFSFFTTNIFHMLTDRTYLQACPWGEKRKRVEEIIEHAFAFATSYWLNFCTNQDTLPEMFTKVHFEEKARHAYIKNLKTEWRQLRPKVLECYLEGMPTSPMEFDD